jgi:hypothetical protein
MTMAQCAQRLILGLTGRMIEPLQSRWTPCTVHMAHFTSTTTTRNHDASVRAYQYRSNTCQKTDTRSMLGCHGNWCYQPVRFAGHSHWHNIRHTKMANEKIKAKVNSKIIQKIQLALRGKSIDKYFYNICLFIVSMGVFINCCIFKKPFCVSQ